MSGLALTFAALPEDIRIVRANEHGDSNIWFITGRIDGIRRNGDMVSYFVKYGGGSLAKAQLEGEFESMRNIFAIMPDIVPKPHSWGSLEIEGDTQGYFYVSDFIKFNQASVPDPATAGFNTALLHKLSRSSEKRFGFHAATYDGLFCQLDAGYEAEWFTLFQSMLSKARCFDRSTNGPWKELDLTMDCLIRHVVPRLIGALEWNGRKIEPCFIHGDLWEGNFGTEASTGKLFVFDAAGYYAHNEMELGMWRTTHHSMHAMKYRQEYFKHMPPSEPAEEVDDRIRLYSIKSYLMYSAHCRGHYARRQ
ncbi:MAG: hypothetical protein Q9227_000672 [Pyrenula ochraceoflavens]